ncbi:LPXTG cell wall anchor domain-containing protein [Bacillus thuringiensis]|uniref:LPXTG cell wall anchor domain-containing protein n=1 Tax=Bacillus thuringiensis TaxID=1428 RepID=UPI002DB7BD23|nr:LPXTG cell wall anchor domain-containing protein [Bacillus thuringiensis]MEC3157313.1 LPXTG cell wall anchor domain-containing protein [Bacillus thuringiensis]
MTKIFILASTLSLSFFSGLNIGNAATENFRPLTNAIVQNSDHFAEGNSKDNNKPPGNNGSQNDSGSGDNGSGGNGSGGSGSGDNGSGGNGSGGNGSGGNGSGGNGSGGNGSKGGNRVKGDSSSQGGNGSQGGNRVKGDSSGNGSQGGNVKDNAKKQGDKLPNTATHYPASILMGLSTFLIGMLLFIRRKNAK